MATLSPPSAGHLSAENRTWLRRLGANRAASSWTAEIYLAGSAALGAYIGHRKTCDLDFMSRELRMRSAERRDLMGDLLRLDEGLRVETARDGFLFVRRSDGGALRFYHYPYPLVDSEQRLEDMRLAALMDLGLMKLGAIISRGARRDFIDLFLICQHLTLERMMSRAAEKFPHVLDFPLQAFKGLSDLQIARQDPHPVLEREVDWRDVESWIASEVRDVARRYVGLTA